MKKRTLSVFVAIMITVFGKISLEVKKASAHVPPRERAVIEEEVNETNYFLEKTVKDLSKIKLKTVREAEDMFKHAKDEVNKLSNTLRDSAEEMGENGLRDGADKLLETARHVDIFFSRIVGFTSILEDIEKFEINLGTVRSYGRKIKKHHKSIEDYVKSMRETIDDLEKLEKDLKRLKITNVLDIEIFRDMIHDLAMASISARLSNIAMQIGEIRDHGEYSSDLILEERDVLVGFAKELYEDGIFNEYEYYYVIDWCNKYLEVGPYKK